MFYAIFRLDKPFFTRPENSRSDSCERFVSLVREIRRKREDYEEKAEKMSKLKDKRRSGNLLQNKSNNLYYTFLFSWPER